MRTNMIAPHRLIRGDASTGSFPGDFAELAKWFRRPGRPFRRRHGTKQLHGIESRARRPYHRVIGDSKDECEAQRLVMITAGKASKSDHFIYRIILRPPQR